MAVPEAQELGRPWSQIAGLTSWPYARGSLPTHIRWPWTEQGNPGRAFEREVEQEQAAMGIDYVIPAWLPIDTAAYKEAEAAVKAGGPILDSGKENVKRPLGDLQHMEWNCLVVLGVTPASKTFPLNPKPWEGQQGLDMGLM
jgi:hypothetical protein